MVDEPEGGREEREGGGILGLSFWMFSVFAAGGGLLCWLKGEEVFYEGLRSSFSLLLEVFPRLIPAFLLAGLVEVLSPKRIITKWIGKDSGMRGIVVATLGGMFTPGGPMVSFPLIAALAGLGADAGPLIAYLTSWAILGVQRIVVWEVPFLGLRFALLRFSISLVLPFIAGVTAGRLSRNPAFQLKRGGG